MSAALPPPSHRPAQRGRRLAAREQSGAIAILGVFTLLLALTLTGLTLETARLWLTKRDLQSTADMAAMAAARYTGCGSTREAALQAAQNVIAANGLTSGYTFDLQRGIHGRDAVTRVNTFQVNESESSNAVQVTLTRTVEPSVMAAGLTSSTSTVMKVTATAKGGPPQASFSIGSFASITQNQANFITNLFRAILGNSSLNLGVAALTDLAGTSVNLLALQAAAGAATIEELLDRQVPIDELFRWLATASPSASAAAQLSQLGSVSINSGLKVRLRDVLNIQVPASAASATVNINLLDLVQTSLLVGKGKGTINLGLNIAGVGGVTLNLLNPPKIAIGPAGKSLAGAWCTQTQSAQMSIKVGINPLNLGLVDMALYLDLLSTSGNLASLSIAPGNTQGQIEVGSTLVSLRLRNNADTNLASVFGGLLQVGLNIPVGQAKGGTAPFKLVTTAELPKTVQTAGVGSGTFAGLLGQDTSLVVKVLGLGGDLLKPLVNLIVSPILGTIGALVIDPLLNALGIDIGLVRVKLNDVESAKPMLII